VVWLYQKPVTLMQHGKYVIKKVHVHQITLLWRTSLGVRDNVGFCECFNCVVLVVVMNQIR